MINKVFKFILIKIQYFILTVLNYIIPKSNKSVFIFDKRFRKDNVWAIKDYLSSQERYVIYYYTKSNPISEGNVIYITNSIVALWRQLRSKYIFYSYRDIRIFKATKNQIIMDTMHGSPLKKIGYLTGSSKFKKMWKFEKTFTHILCTSEFFKEIIKKSFGANDKQCLILGYPRNDYIFKKYNSLEKIVPNKDKYEKIILWMPTYRGKYELGKSPDMKKAFPVLNQDNIKEFNQYLFERDAMVLIKPHPNQLELDFLTKTYSNIRIIRNEDLVLKQIELYSLFSEVDALLSDYSSVYFDFLLTLKPIGFVIDDVDNYEGTRGFTVENPYQMMPGEKIHDMNGLFDFVEILLSGKDTYYEERKRVNSIVNKYQDGNSSKRIVDYLGM